jgi:hypothetical protein
MSRRMCRVAVDADGSSPTWVQHTVCGDAKPWQARDPSRQRVGVRLPTSHDQAEVCLRKHALPALLVGGGMEGTRRERGGNVRLCVLYVREYLIYQ